VPGYTGLRRGEIEGLEWTDHHDGELNMGRSIWNGEVVAPKTEKSKAAVLAERLEMHRLRNGNPETGPIFSTSNGTPLSLHNVVNRQILPTLNRCSHCRLTEGLPHLKAKECPGYERDQSIYPEWQGFHAARRGLGGNLYYIKSTASDVKEAMQQFEQNIAGNLEGQNLRNTNGTPKQDSGATSGLLN
jgi:hypothetical protein